MKYGQVPVLEGPCSLIALNLPDRKTCQHLRATCTSVITAACCPCPHTHAVDGKQLAQSSAIERYAAKLAGITPSDPWETAKVDELLAAAGKEPVMAKRKAMYSQMQKIVVDECPVAFLLEFNFNMAFNAKVQNRPAGIWGLVDGITDTSIKG